MSGARRHDAPRPAGGESRPSPVRILFGPHPATTATRRRAHPRPRASPSAGLAPPARRDGPRAGITAQGEEDRIDEQRRHRVDADVHGAGDDHAAGAGALLRRPRPPQERALDDHAQLLRAGDRERRLGPRRVQPGLRAGRHRQRPDRQPRLRRVHERRPRAERGLRDDDPVRPLRRLPADVRGDHAGPDHRRVRRAEAVRLVRPLHDPLVDRRLLARRPLGLGDRRLAVQARRPRLRRRHRRPRQLGPVRADRRPPHRQARRQRRADGAARHPDDGPRRRAALVRLVRVQRRVRASPPAGSRRAPSSSRTPRPPRRPSPGSVPATSTTARSASSGPPAARSPGSSRSPRRRAS